MPACILTLETSSMPEDALEALIRRLPPARRERLFRLHPAQRRESAGAAALACCALQRAFSAAPAPIGLTIRQLLAEPWFVPETWPVDGRGKPLRRCRNAGWTAVCLPLPLRRPRGRRSKRRAGRPGCPAAARCFHDTAARAILPSAAPGGSSRAAYSFRGAAAGSVLPAVDRKGKRTQAHRSRAARSA